ncbi:hypothetical protein B0H14DRAFT_2572785 [Mycena olivaceomarginata]|nr:hypothetical protein B0H14DRAFT_2572785 [Mycena olivaceomarginata]
MSHADWIFDGPQSYLSLRYAAPRTLCMPTPHATWGSTTYRTSSPVVAPDDATTSPCGDAAACTSSARRACSTPHRLPPSLYPPCTALLRRAAAPAGRKEVPVVVIPVVQVPAVPVRVPVRVVVHRHGREYGPHAFFGAGGLVPAHGYPVSAYPQTPYQRQQVAGQRHARARPAGTNVRTPDAARNTTELALSFRSFGSAGGCPSALRIDPALFATCYARSSIVCEVWWFLSQNFPPPNLTAVQM